MFCVCVCSVFSQDLGNAMEVVALPICGFQTWLEPVPD
jgi:hypothetical protein